ncbi:TM2 domain-containing protein CG10795-like [Lineus longissimus]|uniref:TM2 domain-containing protein CG10795-like n=1 Tax=Lineus longissimus TaxID=88925 RepID=UPI00315D5B9A
MPSLAKFVATLLVVCSFISCQTSDKNDKTTAEGLKCDELRMGQYKCDEPIIDFKTQQPAGCSKNKRSVPVKCYPAEGVVCNGGDDFFTKEVPCEWTEGKSFETALLLSIFLGMFGIDRFYLGYPALGLLKFCTLGFMFLGQLVDILLIAMQVVGPADGSNYIIDYYGAKITKVMRDNDTDLF